MISLRWKISGEVVEDARFDPVHSRSEVVARIGNLKRDTC